LLELFAERFLLKSYMEIQKKGNTKTTYQLKVIFDRAGDEPISLMLLKLMNVYLE